jgi:nitrogen PTS system EIIA component
MDIIDFLSPERVVLDLRCRDKAQVIGEIARHFARAVPLLSPHAVDSALLARERLGSTGLGGGFALPHARIEGLERFLGLFMRLAKPLDFDAIDGRPVSLVFVLLIPSEGAASHMGALAAISRRFRDPDLATHLRRVRTPMEAYGFLTRT